ncbi:MAG: histidine kinase dimerization/phosphoacceptor domain -containing protein [Erythrobacter sp.]|jgi:PAS domain S-box-containing protein|nr:histidine kinase dimerization/phosphoacceptor domain -containing protein [Erythrobacter sp.]
METSIDMGVLFDSLPTAQMVFRPDLHVVAANRRYCEMLGIDRSDLVGKRVFEAFPANPDDPQADAEEELQASADLVVATGEAQEMPLRQHDLMLKDGQYAVRYWRVLNSPVFADRDDPAKVTHIIHTAEDITASILGDRVHEAKRRAAMRGADLAYFEWCPATQIVSKTPQLDTMFGFAEEEQSKPIQPFLDRVHPDDLPGLEAEMERVSRTVGADLHHDYRVVWPDGTTRWLIVRGESIRNPDTDELLVVGMLLDVTHIKESEARLHEAISVRDLLIAEVNHRVKNSLQMVTSILSLEAKGAEDESARASLSAATARVQAIAAIHASLYEDNDLQTVRLDNHVGRLVEHLRASLPATDDAPEIVVDIEPLRLSIDKAVTLSLAINELVTNSFKHASWPDEGGAVTVELRQNGHEQIVLEVSDNGTGGADGLLFEEIASSGLGARLIRGMAAQLRGTIEEERGNGWKTRILFPG